MIALFGRLYTFNNTKNSLSGIGFLSYRSFGTFELNGNYTWRKNTPNALEEYARRRT